ncbi:hypothetical protein DFP72DRAFT_850685 [Ephemerocybe angulata]|uniref:Uncharacterized protein n=1 Tax=Ephemerocybe angulata TaxID=980116 RepID=A0A8H6M379_9AGAR|nr:hypothetical protein DFP72DRAFT_850685 [Tulosesus angulatus]
MAATIEDLRKLSRMKFSPKQVTLHELLAGLEKVVWDNAQNDFVVCTHAFVVRFASPLDSGNFCPDGAQLPEGLARAGEKSSSSGGANRALCAKYPYLSTCEQNLISPIDWRLSRIGEKVRPGFQPKENLETLGIHLGRWQLVSASPSLQTSSRREQGTTSKMIDTKFHTRSILGYPNSQSLITPPGFLTRTLFECYTSAGNNVLEPIEKASNPKLDPGDVVTMSFKVAFSATGLFWNMSFVPIQIIRIGQMNESELDSGGHAEDHAKLALPRIGERLRAFMPDREQEPSPVIRTQEHADEGLEEDNENLADAGGSTSDAGTESAEEGVRSVSPLSDIDDTVPTEDEADIYDEAEDSETESRQQFKTEVVGNGSGWPERNSEKQRVYNRGTKRPATTKNTRSVKAKTGD